MKPLRIVLSGGGTAGTFTPLLAVRQAVRRLHPQTEWLFIGSSTGPERAMAEAAGVPFQAVPAGKLRRYWSWKNVSDLLKIRQGFRAARGLLREWRPDAVLSAGAYVSVPVAWAARSLGVRVMIHQQDVLPGLANRLMAPFADRITVTFPQSERAFPKRKVRLTGNPVRDDILSGSIDTARQRFSLQPHVPVLLILGGSSGSEFLNNLIGATAYRLVQQWQIIHLSGPEREFVELQDERYHRFPFLTWEMPHALAAADLVVTRAGMNIISELAALGKPAIFFPMPGTHQQANAAMLGNLRAGLVLDQNSIEPDRFVETVEQLRMNRDERRVLGENIHQLYRSDAADRMATELIQLAR